jgi:RNase P/RNase MRP subunit POP5
MSVLQISTDISTAVENLRALLIEVREGEGIIACRKADFKRFVVTQS